jgi:hypothetical protein
MCVCASVFVMALMCRLNGRKDCIHFKDDWIPMAHGVVTKGIVFNWGAILSQALKKDLEKAKGYSTSKGPSFHMASYLLDNVCAHNTFQGMGWQWTSS